MYTLLASRVQIDNYRSVSCYIQYLVIAYDVAITSRARGKLWFIASSCQEVAFRPLGHWML